jgi:hypothetical protein
LLGKNYSQKKKCGTEKVFVTAFHWWVRAFGSKIFGGQLWGSIGWRQPNISLCFDLSWTLINSDWLAPLNIRVPLPIPLCLLFLSKPHLDYLSLTNWGWYLTFVSRSIAPGPGTTQIQIRIYCKKTMMIKKK